LRASPKVPGCEHRIAHLVEGQIEDLQVGEEVHLYREVGETVGTKFKLPGTK
jgi:hypothetical protein